MIIETLGYLQSGSNLEPWELDSYSYQNKDYDFTGFSVSCQGIAFKNDGSKIYLLTIGNNIIQFSCTTNWDIEFLTSDAIDFSPGEAVSPLGFVFSDDGLNMYVVSNASDTVFQYSLSTAWVVNTASYTGNTLVTTTQDNSPYGVWISPDGTKFFVLGDQTNSVYRYTMSTPYNIGTASFDSGQVLDFTAEIPAPGSLTFKPDGSKIYVGGRSDHTIYQRDLSSAFDLTSDSNPGDTLVVSGQGITPVSLRFKDDDGENLFVLCAGPDTVFQYFVP